MRGTCPICDARLEFQEELEEAEVVVCSDCGSRLVVERIEGEEVIFSQAPEVEEDWGE